MKKILIIASSPRRNGNSEMLCDQFAKGAAENGHAVQKITLAGRTIGGCTGCYACHNGKCFQKDDAPEIIDAMMKSDVIVLATPVYFYTMCSQLKALIDRSVMVYPELKAKEFYYIATMADTAEDMFKGTVEALRGFVACCENSREMGMVLADGVYEKGAVAGTVFMDEAYQLGKGVK